MSKAIAEDCEDGAPLVAVFSAEESIIGGAAIPGDANDDSDESDEMDNNQLEVAQSALYADWSERVNLL